MSPLKIEILLRMHSLKDPFDGYSPRKMYSNTMQSAFKDFREQGIIRPDVLIERHWESDLPGTRLTPKGEDLVRRLKEVEP